MRLDALERDVKRAATDLLDVEKIPWYRMQSGSIVGKTNGRRWRIQLNRKGTPDILAHVKISQHSFWVVWIETKRQLKGEQRIAQQEFQKEAESRGEFYLLIRSSDELLFWMKENGLKR